MVAGVMVAGVMAAGVIVASGGPASAARPMQQRNPCSVLSTTEIEDAVGGGTGAPVRAGERLCRWFVRGAVADRSERTVVLLSVERYRGRAKRDIAENVREPSAVKLRGLSGAEISFYDLEVVPPTVTVVTGKTRFVVQMNDLDTRADTVAALEALAESALADLSGRN